MRQLKQERLFEYRNAIADIVEEITSQDIRGSDADIDSVMMFAFVMVVIVGVFIFMQLKSGGTSLPMAQKNRYD